MFLYEFLQAWIADNMENPAKRALEAARHLTRERQLADQMYVLSHA